MKIFTPFKTKVTLVLVVMMTFTITVFAQSEKMSVSTLQFLDKRDAGFVEAPKGILKKKQQKDITVSAKTVFTGGQQKPVLKSKNSEDAVDDAETGLSDSEDVADPVVVDGKNMVSCFISLIDDNYDGLEKSGVIITAEFNNLVTALVPVDNIEKIAQLNNVTRINVAKKLNLLTNNSRTLTKSYDAINFSEDAQIANLLQAYNGTNVVIGVIDTGIQFDHIFFKDANGNSRVKKAYVVNNNGNVVEANLSSTLYDTTAADHGTHTSSIAGGSSLDVTSYDFDPNNEGGQAFQTTFHLGGMAPKADLVLCGLGSELLDTYIVNCIQKINQYAQSVGKPCVISISIGSNLGAHDGTGEMATVCESVAEDGAVVLFSAGNSAMNTNGSGIYVEKNSASSNAPLQTIVNETNKFQYDVLGQHVVANNMLANKASDFWAREANVPLAARIYVVNTKNNSVVWISSEITSNTTISSNTYDQNRRNRWNSYFESIPSQLGNISGSGTLNVYIQKDSYNNKYHVKVQPNYCWSRGYDSSTSGSLLNWTFTNTNYYSIGVSIYPRSNTTSIDGWTNAYFKSPSSSISGYSFLGGNDLCSVTNESTIEYAIPVGAYTGRTAFLANDGSGYSYNSDLLPYNDIAYFSSWKSESHGPSANVYPWITAPGVGVIAGYNKGRFKDSYYDKDEAASSYLYGFGDGNDNPIGYMDGTSMACPTVAGIAALWKQADPTLTVKEIKKIMMETAIHDGFTDGNHQNRFGNGKIDALAGLQYITTYQLDENQLEITDMLPYDEDTEQGLMSYDHKRYVEYPRSLAAGWASICLPFSTTVEELEAFGVEKVVEYKGTKEVGDYKFMAKFESTTTLNANTPYLVKLTDAKTKVEFKRGVNETWSPGDEGTYVAVSPEADNIIEVRDEVNDAYTMTGTEIYYDGSNNDSPIVKGDYIFSSTTINAVKGGNKLRAFRAYLKATPGIADAAQIAGYTFDGEDLTGIEAVQVDELFGGPAYNLRGQRVTTPQKGIIIQNGKKRVVK